MKTSTIILLICVLGMTTAAWTNSEKICSKEGKEGKEGSASAEGSESAEKKEKTWADASCEMLAGAKSKVLGHVALDDSACDGANSAELKTMKTEILDAISTTKCDVCTIYWKKLTAEQDEGMESGCKTRKKIQKGKGGESSGSGSSSGSAEGSGTAGGKKSKCRRGMGKDGMGGGGLTDDDMSAKKAEKKAEMTDEEIDEMEKKKYEMLKSYNTEMCAMLYANMNGMGQAVADCASTFMANSEFDAEGVDELMADMYDTHQEKWDAMDCKTVTGQDFAAAATEAGIAAALSGFLSSQVYLFNFGMLIAVLMAFFN